MAGTEDYETLIQDQVFDLYSLLGVSPTASLEKIKSAYKDLLANFEDSSPNVAHQSAGIAYIILIDPNLRTQYDRERLDYVTRQAYRGAVNDAFLLAADDPSILEELQCYASGLMDRVNRPRQEKRAQIIKKIAELRNQLRVFEEQSADQRIFWPVSRNKFLRAGGDAICNVTADAKEELCKLEDELAEIGIEGSKSTAATKAQWDAYLTASSSPYPSSGSSSTPDEEGFDVSTSSAGPAPGPAPGQAPGPASGSPAPKENRFTMPGSWYSSSAENDNSGVSSGTSSQKWHSASEIDMDMLQRCAGNPRAAAMLTATVRSGHARLNLGDSSRTVSRSDTRTAAQPNARRDTRIVSGSAGPRPAYAPAGTTAGARRSSEGQQHTVTREPWPRVPSPVNYNQIVIAAVEQSRGRPIASPTNFADLWSIPGQYW